MIDVTPFEKLGRFDNDWLRARYHFNFANYYDPRRTGFGPLLVWNDDTIQPKRGFDFHGHRDMEIISYIRSGALSHRDSLGHDERVPAGTIQVMSAGHGIVHSEHNREDEPMTLFQIWIQPSETGIEPRYVDAPVSEVPQGPGFVPLASGRVGVKPVAAIQQDASVLRLLLGAGEQASHPLGPARRAYLVGNSGQFKVNGVAVKARDGIAVAKEDNVLIEAASATELILVDIP
jgi:hypothetical protein